MRVLPQHAAKAALFVLDMDSAYLRPECQADRQTFPKQVRLALNQYLRPRFSSLSIDKFEKEAIELIQAVKEMAGLLTPDGRQELESYLQSLNKKPTTHA